MKRIIVLMVLSVAILFSANAQKKSVLTQILKNGELKVGMTGNQPPYNMVSTSGELVGYEVDFAKLLAEALGVKLTLVKLPFNELLPALADGKVEIIMSGMTITAERTEKAKFIGPYKISGKSILTKSTTLSLLDETAKINNPKVTLVTLKGSTSERFVKENLPKATLLLADSYDQAIEMVINNKVKAMIADVEICQVATLKHPQEELAYMTTPFTVEPIGMAIRPNANQLENLINNYYSTLKMVGAIAVIDEKWFNHVAWILDMK